MTFRFSQYLSFLIVFDHPQGLSRTVFQVPPTLFNQADLWFTYRCSTGKYLKEEPYPGGHLINDFLAPNHVIYLGGLEAS